MVVVEVLVEVEVVEVEVLVEVAVTPLRTTDQDVPLRRPLSVNVTVYVARLNTIDTVTGAPATFTEPEEGVAV